MAWQKQIRKVTQYTNYSQDADPRKKSVITKKEKKACESQKLESSFFLQPQG